MDGFLLVDKPSGWSSFDVIRRLRKHFPKKTKLGHGGTLDPFATGLLVVLVGKATRLMPYVVGHDKRYHLVVQLGARSTTDDGTGELMQSEADMPSEDAIIAAVVELQKSTEQVPPQVSAVHVDGERAYRRARRGEEMDLPSRSVVFHTIEIESIDCDTRRVTLDVCCSSGTYMRALARDLGDALGCGGYAQYLLRSEVGDWSVIEAVDAEDESTDFVASLQPMQRLIALPTTRIRRSAQLDFIHGKLIPISTDADRGTDVAIIDGVGDLIGIADVADSNQVHPRIVLVSEPQRPRVVCLGVFDGVHRGHQSLIDTAATIGEVNAMTVCAATFWPHPRSVVSDAAPALITGIERRIRLLRSAGAESVAVIPFTQDLARLAPEEFVSEWLVNRFGAGHVVVGPNFRFGQGGKGDFAALDSLCREQGVGAHECAGISDDSGVMYSSSRVRELIEGGNVVDAAEVLGRPFALDGEIRPGAQRGRTIGYPTANLHVEGGTLLPAPGVYGGHMRTIYGTYRAAISVGTNQQFDVGDQLHIEAYLLDYIGHDLYDTRANLGFELQIRNQATFASVDALVEQITRDVAEISAM